MSLNQLIKKIIPRKIKEKIKNKMIVYVYDAHKVYELNVNNTGSLVGKNVVVTGGAGAIGRAISVRLASEGAKVYVAGRTEATIMRVVDEIHALGLRAEKLMIDVCDEEGVDRAFDEIFSVEKLDILVNCAGGGAREQMNSLDKQSVEVIDSVIETNLRGTMLCTRKAAQYMIPNNGGKIVMLSSAVGVQGKANYSEYAAAKAGIFGFVKSMALELGPYGINVNCITPGLIQRGEYNQETKKHLESTNCLQSVGTLEDVANAVHFMVSDESKFITGQNLCVDGGRTLGLMGD